MKTIKSTLILIMVSIFMLSSCSKEPGFEGKNNIKGTVTMNGAAVSHAIVHIAFNQKAGDGTFDASVATDANGNYIIPALSKGDYYVEAQYTNPMQITFKSNGAYVTIGSKKEDITVNLELK